MDDIWVRAGVILAVLAIAGLLALIQRRRARSPVRTIDQTGRVAGVYFFSSATCSTCDAARKKLDAAIGETGYIEIAWEVEPGPFEDLGVDAVPSVLLVEKGGRGRLYPGQPELALEHL